MARQENDVALIAAYGGDKSHAAAAWASTNQEVTKDKLERIPALLEMLASNGHGTPFEHSQISYKITSDIATHIQFLKHRIGVSINSESARYKEMREDKFYVPHDWPQHCQDLVVKHVEESQKLYHALMDDLQAKGIDRKRAKESARYVLPYAQQINYTATFNFRSLMHFLALRHEAHAQEEIREIARKMLKLLVGNGNFYYSLYAYGY